MHGEFSQKTLDSLLSHIAVLNQDGIIIAVNAPWKNFASRNGLAEQFCGIGANYLRSCDQATGESSEEAPLVAGGIRDVITRKREHFHLEYPCHSPTEQRWFNVRITRFEMDKSIFLVVAHDDITQKKLAELKIQETNRRLEFQSATDGLTGVANRRHFECMLLQEWKRHNRIQLPLSLAMLDLDCFKQYNDKFGHLEGDDCLKKVVRAVQSQLKRPGDLVARYGGEEFAIILPNTDMAGATTVLKNVLRSIRQLAIPHPCTHVGRGIVTVSIGCATAIPGQGEAAADFLHLADQALYESKASGRDQLRFFEQEGPAFLKCP